ncbi:serine hydrolase domain-containing protein [Tunicatimonas pelagia]|uniref:serine hydrolase domain-containing protein n=1 Tax=Tunicatimonas pelagia TaxID=931531 RepID=UPI0026652459|nr:serine hydrolase domain-containing protein [Tunicatimonas pelagia]WKN44014.1 serine hydrolase [Tunicatimonas pelagia]
MAKKGVVLFLGFHWLCRISLSAQSPPQTLSQLQDTIEAYMASRHIPGSFLTMVTQDSVIWQGGIGTANVTTKAVVNDNTLFKMGSVTKSIAALATLKLVEQGRLSLNDKVRALAPELPIRNDLENTHPVTVEHLLEHTAGLDDEHLHTRYRASQPGISVQQLVDIHQNSMYCRWKPGTRHSYTNVGYVVLSYLIEKVSEKPYQKYIAKNIFQPLGMTYTHLDALADVPNEAMGYEYKSNTQHQAPVLNGALAGNLASSAKDMTELLFFFLNKGKIDSTQLLSSASLHRMESTRTTTGARAGLADYYGLGNTLGHTQDEDKIIFRGHGGSVPGFVSYYGYNREQGIGYAVAINAGRGLRPIRQLVADFLTQHLPEKNTNLPATYPLNQEYITPFLGFYQHRSSKDAIGNLIDQLGGVSLKLESNRLYMQPPSGAMWELVPVTDSTFRYTNTDFPAVALTKDDEGNSVLVTMNSYYRKTARLPLTLLKATLIGSAIIGLSVLPFGLVWGVAWARKKLPTKEALFRLPAVLSVVIALFTLATAAYLFVYKTYSIGSQNWLEIAVYLGTIFAPALAVLTLAVAGYRLISQQKTLLNYYLLSVALSLSIISAYLATEGLVGFRLWNY